MAFSEWGLYLVRSTCGASKEETRQDTAAQILRAIYAYLTLIDVSPFRTICYKYMD